MTAALDHPIPISEVMIPPPSVFVVDGPPKPSGFVVVERELIRASRRWQTFALRAIFAGTMLVCVTVFWAEQVQRDVSWRALELNQAGRRIFSLYAAIQVILLGMLTPVVVSQALVEEKNARTLELLATTRLTPTRILWGKLLSRILTLEVLVLAGTPVLALCLSLGGVEPVQIVNLILQSNVIIFGLATVSAFVALYAKGPIVPALMAWAWAFGVWIVGGWPLYRVFFRDSDVLAWLSPIHAVAGGHGLEILGPTFAIVPIGLAVFYLTSRTFSALAGGGSTPGQEELSADLWALESLKKRVGLSVGLLFLTIPVLVILFVLASRSRVLPWELFGLAMWSWNVAVLGVGTLVFLFVCRWAFRMAGTRQGRRVHWRRLAADWNVEPVVEPVVDPSPDRAAEPVRASSRLQSSLAPRLSAGMRHDPLLLRPVWSNPVAWRETVTGAHGALTRWIGKLWIAGLALLLLGLLATMGGRRDPEMYTFLAFAAFFAAAVIVVLTTASSVAGEMRCGTLPLLCSTPMSSRAILRGKLAGVAAIAAAPALTSVALLIAGLPLFAKDWMKFWYDATTHPDVLVHRWFGMSIWAICALIFLATSCQALALRSRTPGRAWISCMLWAAALLFVPTIVFVFGHESASVINVLSFFNPAYSEDFWQVTALSPRVFGSAGCWLLISFSIYLLSAWKLGDRAAR